MGFTEANCKIFASCLIFTICSLGITECVLTEQSFLSFSQFSFGPVICFNLTSAVADILLPSNGVNLAGALLAAS